MASLVYTVYLSDAEGVPHHFGPGDEVPDWARKAITNPDAWDGAATDDDSPPPQGGPGSGLKAWLAYAEKHGVAVDSEWSRDDVIEALEKAGVAV